MSKKLIVLSFILNTAITYGFMQYARYDERNTIGKENNEIAAAYVSCRIDIYKAIVAFEGEQIAATDALRTIDYACLN